MHAKLRYSAVLAFLICLCLLYLLAKHASAPQHRKARRSYLGRTSDEGQSGPPGILGGRNNVLVAPPPPRPLNSTLCTMASCFDFSLCSGRPFRLYVYPLEDAVAGFVFTPSVDHIFSCKESTLKQHCCHVTDFKDVHQQVPPSSSYMKILAALRESRYGTYRVIKSNCNKQYLSDEPKNCKKMA